MCNDINDMKDNVVAQQTLRAPPAMRSLSLWAEQVGICATTAWRWRKQGWIETINVAGRQYVSDAAIAKFTARAAAGEFAQEHKTPRRTKVVAA